MTLLEAIESGLPFKRPEDKEYYRVNKQGWIVHGTMPLPPTRENLTATDWSLDEEPLLVTKDQLYNAIDSLPDTVAAGFTDRVWTALKEDLCGET